MKARYAILLLLPLLFLSALPVWADYKALGLKESPLIEDLLGGNSSYGKAITECGDVAISVYKNAQIAITGIFLGGNTPLMYSLVILSLVLVSGKYVNQLGGIKEETTALIGRVVIATVLLGHGHVLLNGFDALSNEMSRQVVQAASRQSTTGKLYDIEDYWNKFQAAIKRIERTYQTIASSFEDKAAEMHAEYHKNLSASIQDAVGQQVRNNTEAAALTATSDAEREAKVMAIVRDAIPGMIRAKMEEIAIDQMEVNRVSGRFSGAYRAPQQAIAISEGTIISSVLQQVRAAAPAGITNKNLAELSTFIRNQTQGMMGQSSAIVASVEASVKQTTENMAARKLLAETEARLQSLNAQLQLANAEDRSGIEAQIRQYEIDKRVAEQHMERTSGTTAITQNALRELERLQTVASSSPSALPPQAEPYARELTNAARNAGIDRDVFAALIGVESNFNPNAANPNSTARGLTQVLAGTANDYYGKVRGTSPIPASASSAERIRRHEEMMFQPEIALQVGALHFASVENQMKAVASREGITYSPALAIAAYHDGVGNVTNSIRAAKKDPRGVQAALRSHLLPAGRNYSAKVISRLRTFNPAKADQVDLTASSIGLGSGGSASAVLGAAAGAPVGAGGLPSAGSGSASWGERAIRASVIGLSLKMICPVISIMLLIITLLGAIAVYIPLFIKLFQTVIIIMCVAVFPLVCLIQVLPQFKDSASKYISFYMAISLFEVGVALVSVINAFVIEEIIIELGELSGFMTSWVAGNSASFGITSGFGIGEFVNKLVETGSVLFGALVVMLCLIIVQIGMLPIIYGIVASQGKGLAGMASFGAGAATLGVGAVAGRMIWKGVSGGGGGGGSGMPAGGPSPQDKGATSPPTPPTPSGP